MRHQVVVLYNVGILDVGAQPHCCESTHLLRLFEPRHLPAWWYRCCASIVIAVELDSFEMKTSQTQGHANRAGVSSA